MAEDKSKPLSTLCASAQWNLSDGGGWGGEGEKIPRAENKRIRQEKMHCEAAATGSPKVDGG